MQTAMTYANKNKQCPGDIKLEMLTLSHALLMLTLHDHVATELTKLEMFISTSHAITITTITTTTTTTTTTTHIYA